MAHHPPQNIEQHIKALYHAYRHTSSTDAKGLFLSASCMQICRPNPSYAATSRAQIVQYLQDAEEGKVPLEHNASSGEAPRPSNSATADGGIARYTIRPLPASECIFVDSVATAAIGRTPTDLQVVAEAEGWVGMRVDLWDEGSEGGLLVKVQYWWRLEAVGAQGHMGGDREGKVWRQCMHDIMYLGPRDGTEGGEGLEILS